jgi:predicted Fe-Mo cluster-binding NifX family protein
MKIAVPTNDKKAVAPKIGVARGFLIIDLDTGEQSYLENEVVKEAIKHHKSLKGDCGEKGLGTGQVIPKKLKEMGVDVFVAKFFGEGMIGNLEYYDIKTITTKKHTIDEVVEEIKKGL